MADARFLQSLWEKPIWEGIWPYMDPIRGVECVREVRTLWLILFRLFRRSRRRCRVLRPSAPSSMPTSASPFFSADVLKKCALVALHSIAEEGSGGENGCQAPDMLLIQETTVNWAVQRVHCGKVRVKLGPKTKAFLHVILKSAMCATSRCKSLGCMGLVTGSLFLKDWELAKVASSCHMVLDMLCQEVHEAW